MPLFVTPVSTLLERIQSALRLPSGAGLMKTRFFFRVLPAVVVVIVALPAPAQNTEPAPKPPAATPAFTLTACPFQVPKSFDRKVECGHVAVPARRGSDTGTSFRLPVAVFRTQVQTPKPEPVVFLHGGPGNGLIPSRAVALAATLDRAAPDRDIILYDQRGTGSAAPRFTCPEYMNYFSRHNGAINAAFMRDIRALLSSCMRRIETSTPYGLAALNSVENVADMVAIRRALGVKRWNVVGTSYGAKLALLSLRVDPGAIRSVVLDSPRLPAEVSNLDLQHAYAGALALTFEACAADSGCAMAYPKLETRFAATVAALEADPISLSTTGGRGPFVLDGARLTLTLHRVYSSGTFINSVPKLITATEIRDVRFLRAALGIPLPESEDASVSGHK